MRTLMGWHEYRLPRKRTGLQGSSSYWFHTSAYATAVYVRGELPEIATQLPRLALYSKGIHTVTVAWYPNECLNFITHMTKLRLEYLKHLSVVLRILGVGTGMHEIKLGDGDERRREKKEMTYRIGLG